jgi:preprotein translocase subunit SecE
MDKKWTHMLFAVAGIILAWILSKAGEWIWGYFGKPNGMIVGAAAMLIAGVVTYVCWRNEDLFELANETTAELAKVSWPSRQETFNSTVVVIVTTILASLILGVFDISWSYVTRKILEPGS